MASTEARRECETEGCSKDAKLQCPTCIKLGIQGSYFCSQECFKGSWGSHKLLHKKAKEDKNQNESKNCVEKDINTDPWPGYRYTGKLRPYYPLTPMRPVPSDIQRPDYSDHPRGISESEQFLKGTSQIKILSPDDIEGMRVVCKLAREVLDIAAMMWTSPSTTTVSTVTSMKPSMFGDVDEEAKKLVQTTYECLMQAIDSVKPGIRYRELGNIIQKHAQANGFSVVRSYCGHGIHRLFHTAPNVPHYAKNKAVGVMKPGHVFTIEPMICEGGWQDETWPDGWTAVTRDGKRSAQFEHTLLVTETGCEILTRRLEDNGRAHFLSQV
ncbi:Methionine aminopeptidase 1 [Nibea albiflora]|uniref:Methionine aminopeptidase 1 n=1 Tax=Nibea albiflora TaxID=240163 RepID=A0ACB7FGZ5_NIBAL|nr:Methionine aminopeptidase 1 [Nibea albiflora]